MAATALLVAACDQGVVDRSLEVALESGPACSYQGPDALTPGEVILTFVNPMKVKTWVHFVKLEEGRSSGEFAERFENSPGAGLPVWSTLLWGPRVVEPETTVRGGVEVDEGVYALVCGLVDPDRGFFAGELTVEN